MKIYAVQRIDFYASEHEHNDYHYFSTSFDKAQDYVQKKYQITINELDEEVMYDDDYEIGERFVKIIEIEVDE